MGDSDIQEINSILNSLEESPQEGVEKIKSLLPRLLNTRLSDKSCMFHFNIIYII